MPFRRRARLIAPGGMTTANIIKMTVWLKDPSDRKALNVEWVKMFPDADDRPARNVQIQELGWNMVVHLEMTAVLPAQ